MTDLFNNLILNPSFQDFWHELIAGEITWLTAIFLLAIATGVSILGGAMGGILLARKDLGYSLAAMIGGLFGPAGVIPTVAIALVVLRLV